MTLIRKLICKVFGHQAYWFVRFEYPVYEPFLWTRCDRCKRALTKVPMFHVPLMELHTRWGVPSDDPMLHQWARNRAERLKHWDAKNMLDIN